MNMKQSFACAVAFVPTAHIGIAQTLDTPRLPEPSGVFGIGRVAYYWTDIKRPDLFSKNPTANRELMVYVWYPTPPAQKTDAGVYLPGAKQINAAAGTDGFRQLPIWSLIVSDAIKSHARESAPLVQSPRRLPLVLFSHGDGGSSFVYTSAIEELVSHGYIVAAVEHPYSSSAVVFPDGRVIQYRQTLRGDRPSNVPYFEGVQIGMADIRQLNEIQAADLSFVLDQLTVLNETDKSSPFYGRLDFGGVAAVGHSLGGMTAVRACQRDARIKACVNQDGGTPDGAFLQYPDAEPFKQPFLYVEATPPPTFTDQQLADRGITRADWTANASKLAEMQERQFRSGFGGSYKVELRAPGMAHGSFGDTPLSATTQEAQRRALHNLRLTVEVTRAFLDKYLKGEQRTLLDAASSNAEVTIRKYAP